MTVEVSALKTLHLFFILSTRYFTNSQCYHACYTHDMRQLLTELVRAQRRQKAETTLRQPRKESDGTPQHHCALAVMREALSSRAVKSRGAG